MSLIRSMMLAVAILASHAAVAEANGASDVRACKAMAAAMGPRQAEITKLTASRDEAAEAVETTGEAWEDSEIHRRASSGHAATADMAKAAYDDATKRLAREEMALQATVAEFNKDVSVFNSRCARK